LAAAQWAQVAPTFPAPMTLILARRMTFSSPIEISNVVGLTEVFGSDA